MWIVRLALRRPYTFVVMAVLIAILGGAAIVTMPVDIFPFIDIPIVSVVLTYTGLQPDEMEKRVVTNFERMLTSNVNDIEHIESQSYNGIAVIRVYFHPNVQVDMAVAQTTATMQIATRQVGSIQWKLRPVDAERPRRGLALLPPVSKNDVFFDIEGFPYAADGLEYLLGIVTVDTGEPVFTVAGRRHPARCATRSEQL